MQHIANQTGAQQAFGSDRGTAAAPIQCLEIVVHVDQNGIDPHPKLAQPMRIGDATLKRAVTVTESVE